MSMNLPWKTAWVTGAGRGIGKALVKQLSREGVTVYASSRTVSELHLLKDETPSYPGRIVPVPLDITSREQVDDLIASWEQGDGVPDLVVLNAGNHDPFPAQVFSAQRCSELLRVNLHGTINCIDPVLKSFIARDRGQLAVMASVAGYRGLPTAAAYGAGKAALINLCEALKLDLYRTSVKLQVINPGFVRTPLTDKNDFKMPALMEADQAADRIIQGLLSERFEITFPRRFTFALKLLRILPYSWYFKLISRTVKTDNPVITSEKHG